MKNCVKCQLKSELPKAIQYLFQFFFKRDNRCRNVVLSCFGNDKNKTDKTFYSLEINSISVHCQRKNTIFQTYKL